MTSGGEEAVRGKVLRRVFSGDEGYTVLSVEAGLRRFRAVGRLLESDVDLAGSMVSFRGSWRNHPSHGTQFCFEGYEIEENEVVFFLSRVVKGLGQRLAREIVERYGEERLIAILEREPSRLLEVKGIKQRKLEAIVASYRKYSALRALASFLGQYGIPKGTIIRIFNHFGEPAEKRIRENPYSVTEVRGIGFVTADRMAKSLGVAADSPYRIQECVNYVLQECANEAGDTALAPEALVDKVKAQLDGEGGESDVARGLVETTLRDMVAIKRVVSVGGLVSMKRYYEQEARILEVLRERCALARMPLLSPEETERYIAAKEAEMGLSFSEEQREAIRLVARGERTVELCGYAGTGKSTIARVLLDLLAERYGRDSVICMALAGIASRRIRTLTGYRANTIHTSLKWNGAGFDHGAHNPLPHRVVLLDESSMVNAYLFRHVLDAVRKDGVLILVGDDAQLPPIGPGDVFADLIRSGRVPAAKLPQVSRQSEDSVVKAFANAVRRGEVPEGYRDRRWRDFEFVDLSIKDYFRLRNTLNAKQMEAAKARNDEDVLRSVLTIAAKARGEVADLVSGVQVLSPVRSGPLGTEALNVGLQRLLNCGREAQAVSRFGAKFKPGDKVVHTENKDMLVMAPEEYRRGGFAPSRARRVRVYNGSLGMIDRMDQEESRAYVVYGDEMVVAYDFMELGDVVEHAYAMSTHKAQGNEFDQTVVVVATKHLFMLSNKWLYTAMTRSKAKLYVVGQPFAFEKACRNVDSSKRSTVLAVLLADGEWERGGREEVMRPLSLFGNAPGGR